MLNVLLLVVLLASLVVAIAAVVHAFMLVGHRREDLTPMQLWMPGHLFYRQSSFKPSGHAMQRRFVILVALLIVLWVARFALGIATGAQV